ncbi:hypothetical protein [Rhizobium sp. 2MFCol3.1]|uniref:hypothetical protein n=1 Tax=Rhizobium sp. 2MFCol3.1 TaxID=1246459 RepID=UPI00037E0830|nr:hypothetical protein [Rhizobium sp. 2MFCol3.1]
MKTINEWLDHNLGRELNPSDSAAVEQQAEFLRAEAEAAGYSFDELNTACGGDIAEYIRNRNDAPGDKMAGDLSPILTPGFNQQ